MLVKLKIFAISLIQRLMKHIHHVLLAQACARRNPFSTFCKFNSWGSRLKCDLHFGYRQVLYIGDLDKTELPLSGMYQMVVDVKDFGIRNIRGGFQRKPELIRQRQPDCLLKNVASLNVSYGLYSKCERIQHELTLKIIDLLQLDGSQCCGKLLLDIGCGHGWSLNWPSKRGFCVVGVDMDLQALSVVQHKADCKYLSPELVHVVLGDISNGLCFRENTFDYALSVSFLQWLCAQRNARQVLDQFFHSLSTVLKPKAKGGIQFYPNGTKDVENVIFGMEKYFVGALVSECPHIDRGRKLFLLIINKK